MIKCNEGEVTIEGNVIQVSSELTMLTYKVLEAVSKQTGRPIEEIEKNHEQSMAFQKLIHSGMDPEESANVLGIEIDDISRDAFHRMSELLEKKDNES